MTIQILGPGCRTCVALDRVTREPVATQALDATVEKVEDYRAIMDDSVMTSPALVIDDQVLPRRPRPQPERATSTPGRRLGPPYPDPAHHRREPHVNIKILGSGCANCVRLEANAKQALAALGLEATVEKVTDYGVIASYGIMRTPGLVVDEQVLVSGRVPDAAEIAKLLTPTA
jgi:small redox-active disulfide protein 2